MTLEELKSNINWWESKRWIYNLAVGLFGSLALYNGLSEMEYSWTVADTRGIIIWGIGANIFYSLGLLFEIFDWYYLNNKIKIVKYRTTLFILGISFSCFWTAWCVFVYIMSQLW